MRIALRISLFSVLLSFDEIAVGIVDDQLPAADEDGASYGPVDSSLIDRIDPVTISANVRLTVEFEPTSDDALPADCSEEGSMLPPKDWCCDVAASGRS